MSIRWPDDAPPPHAGLYDLGQRTLDEVNTVARSIELRSPIENQLLELLRSQALAIGELAGQLVALRRQCESGEQP